GAGDERRESGIASAWVHEDHIRFVPKQYGAANPDKVGPNEYVGEHEVIVAPNHNSELVTRRAAREMIGTDSKGFSSRPSNIDQLISARGEHPAAGKKLTRQYAQRRARSTKLASSDPLGMLTTLSKAES